MMKKYFILLLILSLIADNLHAQSSDFEAWRKQKEEAYDKWKKMRAEIVSHLPSNSAMDAVSSFIDQGFGNLTGSNASSGVAGSGNAAVSQPPQSQPSQPPQQSQPTPQPPAVQPPLPPVNPNIKIWAVIVGVGAYENVQPLSYTKDDAYRMYAFYKSPEGGSLPDRQIALLIDEEATRKNIIKAIRDTYSQAGKDDIIIFYFSGHGAEGAFITSEFDRNDTKDYKGILWHEELQSVFEQSPAKYKYLIADACHAGSFTASASKETGTRSRGTFYQAFEESKGGFVLLLSCMGDEVSLETRGVRQGVFSHYLLRGLKGESDSNKDKIVSVIELFDYVDDNVKNFTRGKQNPVISGNYDASLPIAVLRNDE
jgi:hypothetical protein